MPFFLLTGFHPFPVLEMRGMIFNAGCCTGLISTNRVGDESATYERCCYYSAYSPIAPIRIWYACKRLKQCLSCCTYYVPYHIDLYSCQSRHMFFRPVGGGGGVRAAHKIIVCIHCCCNFSSCRCFMWETNFSSRSHSALICGSAVISWIKT